MRARLFTTLLALCSAPLLAQPHASAPAVQVHTSDIGFSYSLPADWEVVDLSSSLSAAQQQAQQKAESDDVKRGVACLQIVLNAHHGSPGSTVVVMALPTACVGAEATEKDLPGIAIAASQSIQQYFDVGDPVLGAYSLGSHSARIARAKGNPKGHPEIPYTVETVCSLLKKGAVCWMALAADDASLATFENGSVTLDNEAPSALVPAKAFVKTP